MKKYNRVIIPIDGSYKEYNKFEKLFKETVYWSHIYFLVDESLNPGSLKTDNVINVTNNVYTRGDFESLFSTINYSYNFCNFCQVDFAQQNAMYKSPNHHFKKLQNDFCNIYNVIDKYLHHDDVILNHVASHFFQRAVNFIAASKNIALVSYGQSLIPGKEFVWLDGENLQVIFKNESSEGHVYNTTHYKEIFIWDGLYRMFFPDICSNRSCKIFSKKRFDTLKRK